MEGSIFSIADRVIDLIFTKYLKAKITYEHDVRVETYPFPREGVREAIYNALGHNNYAASIPIQIRIEDEAMYISNSCILPPDWTVDTLLEPHKSVPFNPSIASVFFRAGYIEAWGRGVQLIYDSCSEMDAPAPEYKVLGEDLTVKFTALPSAIIPEKTTTEIAVNVGDVVVNDPDVVENDGNVGKNVGKNVGNIGNVGDYKKIIIDMIIANNKVSAREIAESMSVTKRTVERYIKELREEGCLVRHGATHGGYWEVVE